MQQSTKIATCCHCGSRSMLKLDEGHHTLTCANCGAPLRQMKSLPQPAPAQPAVSHQAPARLRSLPKAKVKPAKKAKKRKSLWRKFASEAFDLVEDIFD